MTTNSNPPSIVLIRRPLSKGLNVTCWVLQGLAAFAFLAAGGSKLAGAPAMVDMFARLGRVSGFDIFTGTLEVIGAVGLLVPRATFYGAALLASVMIGAVVAHLAILGGNPTPAIFLLLITGTVAYLRRAESR